MKWRKTAGILASAVFIAGNLYLIFKDDSKVHRSEWLNQWEKTVLGDIAETFQTKGVITPAEEYPVYFDSNLGSFQEFLVEPGEKVEPGTRLFEYSSSKIDDERAKIEAEISKLGREIEIIEDHIDDLESLKDSIEFEDEDDETNGEKNTSLIMIENELLDQEKEKERLQEEVTKYEELESQLDRQKETLIVESGVEGYVKEMDSQLNNPIMTIRSGIPAVQGAFTEKQLKTAQEGQKIFVSVDTMKNRLTGTITKIETYPELPPSVKRKSSYPFTAQLENSDEIQETLLPGLTANVTVVTKESLNAVIVPKQSVVQSGKKSYVYLLTKGGKVEKREIQKGLLVKNRQEVVRGLEKGDIIVTNPKDVQVANTTFITPLNINLLDEKTDNQMGKKEKLKYFLMGLFS
ncbi:MAG TPA: efflux RND transporter periplasmic adaptor subunit [Chondromyces sp.]|nr:efflux RND transporter periplasmic adaptor subunit [Chondromyces sp.]